MTGKLKGRKIPEETHDKIQNEIYYKYLQALSSQIEIIKLRIRPGLSEEVNLEALEKEDIIYRNSDKEIFALVVHVKTRIAQNIPPYPYE